MATVHVAQRKAVALLDVRKSGQSYDLALDGLIIRLSQNEINTLLTMITEAIHDPAES